MEDILRFHVTSLRFPAGGAGGGGWQHRHRRRPKKGRRFVVSACFSYDEILWNSRSLNHRDIICSSESHEIVTLWQLWLGQFALWERCESEIDWSWRFIRFMRELRWWHWKILSGTKKGCLQQRTFDHNPLLKIVLKPLEFLAPV